jgi:hypothetical protein
MRTMLVMLLLGGCSVFRVSAAIQPPNSETPRATDLLRAERLADEIRRRLELPPVRSESAWRRGGQGWPRREPAAKLATDGDVIINVKPPARGPAAVDRRGPGQ